MPTFRRAATLLACACACVALPAAPAHAAKLKPKLGIYDCFTEESGGFFSTPTRSYNESIKFLRKNRYQHSWMRKGKKLQKKKTGTYRVKRAKIIFKGGPMDGIRAQLRKSAVRGNPPQFHQLLENGSMSGIDCTHISAK